MTVLLACVLDNLLALVKVEVIKDTSLVNQLHLHHIFCGLISKPKFLEESSHVKPLFIVHRHSIAFCPEVGSHLSLNGLISDDLLPFDSSLKIELSSSEELSLSLAWVSPAWVTPAASPFLTVASL